ncbi:hypothetical protein SprV_0100285100 [Sparganum proliferum]
MLLFWQPSESSDRYRFLLRRPIFEAGGEKRRTFLVSMTAVDVPRNVCNTRGTGMTSFPETYRGPDLPYNRSNYVFP